VLGASYAVGEEAAHGSPPRKVPLAHSTGHASAARPAPTPRGGVFRAHDCDGWCGPPGPWPSWMIVADP
jgi:hypothetical protein